MSSFKILTLIPSQALDHRDLFFSVCQAFSKSIFYWYKEILFKSLIVMSNGSYFTEEKNMYPSKQLFKYFKLLQQLRKWLFANNFEIFQIGVTSDRNHEAIVMNDVFCTVLRFAMELWSFFPWTVLADR